MEKIVLLLRAGERGVQITGDCGDGTGGADKNDDISVIELCERTGRNDGVLIAANGNNRGAGGLPEMERANSAADLIRVRRHGNLIVGKTLFRR